MCYRKERVVLNYLLKFQRVIMFVTSLVIIISLSITVFLRYIFKIDLFGIEELLIIPIFLLYFFGSSYGSYEDSHIGADLLDSYVKNKKVLAWLHTVKYFVTLAACVVFLFWAFQYFIWSTGKLEKTSGWQIPLFIPHGVVLLGFLLMTLYSFIHLYRQIYSLRSETRK